MWLNEIRDIHECFPVKQKVGRSPYVSLRLMSMNILNKHDSDQGKWYDVHCFMNIVAFIVILEQVRYGLSMCDAVEGLELEQE